jgi:hypothetical protein
VIKALQRLGVTRGVVGSSRFWLWIAVVTTALRVLRRVGGRTEKVIFRRELDPGETLVISHEREAEVVHAPSG